MFTSARHWHLILNYLEPVHILNPAYIRSVVMLSFSYASNIFATIHYVALSYSPCVLHVMKRRYMEVPYNIVYSSLNFEFCAGFCVKVWNHSTKWQDFVLDELLHCTRIDTPFACTSDLRFTLSVLMIRNVTKPTKSFLVCQNTSSCTVISNPGWRSGASWSGLSLTARQWSRSGRCRDISGPASVSFIRLVRACS